MTRWEQLEEFLDVVAFAGVKSFRYYDVAEVLGLAPGEASKLIQAYLEAMVSPSCVTRYTIHRTERTSAAVWHIGHSTKELRSLTGQFADDVENRVVGVITPMVDHIGESNPKARPQVTKTVLRIGRLIQNLADLGK